MHIQVGAYSPENILTWKGHPPLTAFCGTHVFQVVTKSAGMFPTWTPSAIAALGNLAVLEPVERKPHRRHDNLDDRPARAR